MSTEIRTIKTAAETILTNEPTERHSLFQLQCFNLGKEPTIQGKLQQCLREIKARKNSLDSLELEVAEQEDKLILIDLDMEEVNEKEHAGKRESIRKEIVLRGLERKRQAIVFGINELKKRQTDTSEELLFFCSAFDQLNKREKLKPWDDPEVQKEYWDHKLRFEVNTRLLLRQMPDVELMKSIQCLHDDSQLKKKCLEMLRAQQPQQGQAIAQKNDG